MGIKFRCPNGHKLHVKAFLAGKRGICPKCGTKFDIPLTSGGQVAAERPTSVLSNEIPSMPTPSAPSPATSAIISTSAKPEPALPRAIPIATEPVVSTTPVASPPVLATPPTPLPNDPLAEAPDAFWHVRSTNGGQFGPAATNILRQWLDEGRITDDSFIWRDGWAEWRKAIEVFPQLTAPDATLISTPTSIVSPTPAVSTTPTGPTSRHKAGRRQSKQSAMMVSAILLLAVFVLAIALGIVFWFQQ